MREIAGGRIFVDCEKTPKSAFIYQEGGFMYLMSEDSIFLSEMDDCIEEKILPNTNEKEMVIFSFSESTRIQLDRIFKEKGAIWIERKNFAFNRVKFEEIEIELKELTDRYKIQLMNDEDLSVYNKERNLGECGLKKIGLKVMNGSDEVGKCVSIFIGGEEAEIDIEIHEDHRKKGLGKACAVSFIRACLEKGVTPSWSCWPFREGSLTLAKGLGFDERSDLLARFWAENM